MDIINEAKNVFNIEMFLIASERSVVVDNFTSTTILPFDRFNAFQALFLFDRIGFSILKAEQYPKGRERKKDCIWKNDLFLSNLGAL